MRWLLFLISLVPSLVQAQTFSTQVYTEQLYLGREEVIANMLRIREGLAVSESLTPYVQGGSELMTAGKGSTNLDFGGSFAYLAGGLGWKLGKVSLFSELRARNFYRKNARSLQRTLDARLLGVYGNFFETAKTGPWSLFAEPYSEIIYTSGDLHNVIGSGFVRLGTRLTGARGLAIDAFVEPYLTLDRLGRYYNNRADIKPSLRISYFSPHFGLSLLAAYQFNTYFSFADYEVNPYRDRPSGPRILAVINAAL